MKLVFECIEPGDKLFLVSEVMNKTVNTDLGTSVRELLLEELEVTEVDHVFSEKTTYPDFGEAVESSECQPVHKINFTLSDDTQFTVDLTNARLCESHCTISRCCSTVVYINKQDAIDYMRSYYNGQIRYIKRKQEELNHIIDYCNDALGRIDYDTCSEL